MKNKEKYAKEIVEIACDGHDIAVNKNTGKPESCKFLNCNECLFSGHGNKSCNDITREWAESEYIEKPVISKKDRAFLEYIDKKFDYLARTHCGNICIFITEREKAKRYGRVDIFSLHWVLLISISQWSNGKMINRGLSRT